MRLRSHWMIVCRFERPKNLLAASSLLTMPSAARTTPSSLLKQGRCIEDMPAGHERKSTLKVCACIYQIASVNQGRCTL
ncbi:MAG: hypothetical protein K2Y27_17815, partial [Xanthobacteraceae bacterium]|nr:hypothetical protein [Xanthobacteraceae bacterium]